MTARTSQILLIISAFVTGLVVFSGVFLYATGNFGAAGTGSSAIGGPFKLIDQSGNSITDADIKGRPYLVFFGYTHCPDVCPTTLFDVSEVLRALGKDADRAGALFVTVDPERDTPAVMKDYLSSFDPHLRGATGDRPSIDAVEKAYRVYAHGPSLSHGQTGPVCRSVQSQAATRRSRRRLEALSLVASSPRLFKSLRRRSSSSSERVVLFCRAALSSPCSVFFQRKGA